MLDPKFKQFMEDIWDATEINGVKVIDRHLGFGSLPDIKLTLEDGSFVSAKKLFEPITPKHTQHLSLIHI